MFWACNYTHLILILYSTVWVSNASNFAIYSKCTYYIVRYLLQLALYIQYWPHCLKIITPLHCSSSALRRRKAKGSVLPVSSSSFLEKEQRLDHRKDKKVQMNFSYAPWRRCRRALDRVFSFFLMRSVCIRTCTYVLTHCTCIQKIINCVCSSFRYTFLPTSRACAVWEVVVSVAAFFSLITVSLQAAFFHFHPVIWIINYILDAVFIVDM